MSSKPLTVKVSPLGPGGEYMNISIPSRMPQDTDFETYRKTCPQWQKLVEWYNGQRHDRDEGDADSEGGNRRTLQTRFILQQWPRDPNGKFIGTPPEGKHINNNIPLWGATLYDFYMVQRDPSWQHCLTLSSGSRLAAWAKENGELDFAKSQIQQAEEEEEPRVMPPFPIENFVEFTELMVHLKKTGKSLKIDKTENEKSKAFLLPPAEYPGRWPLKPFSTPTCRLQETIPIASLPKKLIVHDPWNCLLTEEGDREQYQDVGSDDEGNEGDTFSASDDGKRDERKGERWRWGSRPDNIYTYTLQVRKNGKTQHVDGDSKAGPGDCIDTPEAHLYITPKRRIGVGHHSFVYQVELELPRKLLVKPKSCLECALDDETPALATKVLYEHPSLTKKLIREFKPITKQVDPPYCKHLDDGVPRPKTARVSVSAKLTIPNDYRESHAVHLRNEARRYMEFPKHLFEHYNGYNIVQPLRDPVPVGAVVPQFYGYYVPDASNKPKKDGVFMSPILLLEHCGVQVDIAKLPLEERHECFSLLRRLHFADYKHNSAYERNILMQHGPVQRSPFERSDLHRRFRLIDFGRTEELQDNDATLEYHSANRTLKLEMY